MIDKLWMSKELKAGMKGKKNENDSDNNGGDRCNDDGGD